MADLDVEFVKANPRSEGEAMEIVKDADAILNRAGWGSEQFIKSTKHCKVLAVYSHGFNHIDAEAATEHGMMVTNGAGMCAEEVSNQAVAFTLALNRQVVQYTLQLRNGGKWNGQEFGPIEPLDEQTLGIIGFGNVGKRFAEMCHGLGLKILIVSKFLISPIPVATPSDEYSFSNISLSFFVVSSKFLIPYFWEKSKFHVSACHQSCAK